MEHKDDTSTGSPEAEAQPGSERFEASAWNAEQSEHIAAAIPMSASRPSKTYRVPRHLYTSRHSQILRNSSRDLSLYNEGSTISWGYRKLSDTPAAKLVDNMTSIRSKHGPERLVLSPEFHRWNRTQATYDKTSLAPADGLDWCRPPAGSTPVNWYSSDFLQPSYVWAEPLRSFLPCVDAATTLAKDALQRYKSASASYAMAAKNDMTKKIGLQQCKITQQDYDAAHKAYGYTQADAQNHSTFSNDVLSEIGRLRIAIEDWSDTVDAALRVYLASRKPHLNVEQYALAQSMVATYLTRMERDLISTQLIHTQFTDDVADVVDDLNRGDGMPPRTSSRRLVANAPDGVTAVLQRLLEEAQQKSAASEEALKQARLDCTDDTARTTFGNLQNIVNKGIAAQSAGVVEGSVDDGAAELVSVLSPRSDRTFYRLFVQDTGLTILDYDGFRARLSGLPEELPFGYLMEKDGQKDIVSSLDLLAKQMQWDGDVAKRYDQDYLVQWDGHKLVDNPSDVIRSLPFGHVPSTVSGTGEAFLSAARRVVREVQTCQRDLQNLQGLPPPTTRKELNSRLDEGARLNRRSDHLSNARSFLRSGASALVRDIRSASTESYRVARREAEAKLGQLTADEIAWLRQGAQALEVALHPDMVALEVTEILMTPPVNAKSEDSIRKKRQESLTKLLQQREATLSGLSESWGPHLPTDFETWLELCKQSERPPIPSPARKNAVTSRRLDSSAFREKYRGVDNIKTSKEVELAQKAWSRTELMPPYASLYNTRIDGTHREIATEMTDFENIAVTTSGWWPQDRRWITRHPDEFTRQQEAQSGGVPRPRPFVPSVTHAGGFKIGQAVRQNNTRWSAKFGGTFEHVETPSTKQARDEEALRRERITATVDSILTESDREAVKKQMDIEGTELTFRSEITGAVFPDGLNIDSSKIGQTTANDK